MKQILGPFMLIAFLLVENEHQSTRIFCLALMIFTWSFIEEKLNERGNND